MTTRKPLRARNRARVTAVRATSRKTRNAARATTPTPDLSPPKGRSRPSSTGYGGGEEHVARTSPQTGAEKKPGPKPGTRSRRILNFTPEATADIRRRYEDTAEYVTQIARDYNVDESTIRRLAKDHGWRKGTRGPLDMPADVKLLRRAQALAAQVPTTPTPNPSPPKGRSRPSSTGYGGGEESAAPPAQDAAAQAAALDRMLREADAMVAQVTALREHCQRTPGTSAEMLRATQMLSNLTATVRTLRGMQTGVSPPSGPDYDDIPADIDAFRDALADRIEAFLASRADEDDDAVAAADREPET